MPAVVLRVPADLSRSAGNMTEDLAEQWKAVSREYFVRPDGTYVGDFDAMYRECEDPWLQRIEASRSPFKRFILWRIAQLPFRRQS
ncbi:MAG: hypothetical protein A3G80_01070 [Betaproteobacteria bacterium RIFCSPLOWO2_12_FULL_62_13b]|nr:MAG: hypothetical protein A3G80_01070 [Betaproteobacteria bacterium RIFCSPLOWO2_12_FULL_62_13b]